MREQLDEESLRSLISYRSNRADETFHEAEILFNENCYNAAINRLYYACYYIISALLVKNGIQAHTHAGTKQMFGLHFIVNGILPKRINTIFTTLYEKRHSSDYDDFTYCERETVEDLMPQVQELIQSVKKILSLSPKK